MIRKMLERASEDRSMRRNELISKLEKEGIPQAQTEATIMSYVRLDSLFFDEETGNLILCWVSFSYLLKYKILMKSTAASRNPS